MFWLVSSHHFFSNALKQYWKETLLLSLCFFSLDYKTSWNIPPRESVCLNRPINIIKWQSYPWKHYIKNPVQNIKAQPSVNLLDQWFSLLPLEINISHGFLIKWHKGEMLKLLRWLGQQRWNVDWLDGSSLSFWFCFMLRSQWPVQAHKILQSSISYWP